VLQLQQNEHLQLLFFDRVSFVKIELLLLSLHLIDYEVLYNHNEMKRMLCIH